MNAISKDCFWTVLGLLRSQNCSHFGAHCLAEFNFYASQVLRNFVETFWFQFQKKCFRGFQTRHETLIRSALKSIDPGASNGGSNFEIRPLEAELVSVEVARIPERRTRLYRSNSKIDRNAHEN